MELTIYNITTGIVAQYLTYPDNMGTFDEVRLMVKEGLDAELDVVEGKVNADLYLIEDGDLVPRPEQEPEPILSRQVKAEAARRIETQFPLWKQMNMIREGEDLSGIDVIRAASNRLEAMKPIPFDYAEDKYWNDL